MGILDAAIDAPPRCQHVDNFDDNTIDTRWMLLAGAQGNVVVTEENQRHDAVGGVVHFEFSSDRANWTGGRSPAVIAWDLTNVEIHIGAGAYSAGNTAPGQARFDNFSFCSPAT